MDELEEISSLMRGPGLTGWKTMDEWQSAEGPVNGTEMLVLLPDGKRVVAKFNGYGQCWSASPNGDSLRPGPVAWAEIPDVPSELIRRNAEIDAKEEALRKLRTSPL